MYNLWFLGFPDLNLEEFNSMTHSKGWIAVDLDGTLAYYDGWKGVEHIGEPIPLMLERVKRWLAEGKDVRIFTARVDGGTVALSINGEQFRNIDVVSRQYIANWCLKHIGQILPITNQKDYRMIELWDDRCVQVVSNTGETIVNATRAEMMTGKGANSHGS